MIKAAHDLPKKGGEDRGRQGKGRGSAGEGGGESFRTVKTKMGVSASIVAW